MRSVVVLALLWQTAVVLSLGAIHVPDNANNNRASTSTLPWIGTEIWTTEIKEFSPDQLFTATARGSTTAKDLYVYGQSRSQKNPPICQGRVVSLNAANGKGQWEFEPVGKCGSDFARQFPSIATTQRDTSGLEEAEALLFNIDASAGTVKRGMEVRAPSSDHSSILGAGGWFFWFVSSSDGAYSMTAMSSRVSGYSKTEDSVGAVSTFNAGLNYLFVMDRARNVVTCISAVSGHITWAVHAGGAKVSHVIPSKVSDIVLVIFSNSSSTLFNASAEGQWIWTLTSKGIFAGGDGSINGVYMDGVVVLMSTTTTTALDLATSKVLWETATSASSQSSACGLDSNIFILASGSPSLKLIGLDAKTGQTKLEYTPISTNSTTHDATHMHCFDNDVYFAVGGTNNVLATVQRVRFAPRP